MFRKMRCTLFIPNKIQWVVAFCHVAQQILKELLLSRVFFVMVSLVLFVFATEATIDFFLFLTLW